MITAPISPSKQWHCRYYSFSVNARSGEHEYCIKKGTFNFECSKQCPYAEAIESKDEWAMVEASAIWSTPTILEATNE